MEIVRFADSVALPWANGKGSTRVLLDDDTGDGWTYRVSVADLSGRQTFSSFPGVRRHLVSLGPGSLLLNINGVERTLQPLESVEFEGEDAVVSEPSERAARDLNIMVRRDAGTARILDITTLELTVQPESAGRVAFVIALEPGCLVSGCHLQPLDVAILPPGQTTRADGRAVLVQIDR